MTTITTATGGTYVQSSYTDWASCSKSQNNVHIATTTHTTAGRGTQILEGLVSSLSTFGAGTPGPNGNDLGGLNILTDDTAAGSFASWEVGWIVMRLPTCTTPALFNDDPRFIVTVTIVPTTRYSSDTVGRASSFFAFKDLYLGQSLASSKHILAQYCDVFFTTAPKPLDVLLDVDNSASMANDKLAVAGLGTAIEAVLQTTGITGIDWRIGLVTTSHYLPNSGCTVNSCGEGIAYSCRYFSTNIQTVKNWLTQGQTSWIGAGSTACATGTEKGMYTSKIMFTDRTDASVGGRQTFMPRISQTVASSAPNNAFRQASNALIVHLGDADDQYYSDATAVTGIAGYLAFFTAIRAQFNNGLYMAGIICPTTSTCGETQRSTRVTRGVLEAWPLAQIGSLQSPSTIGATINSVFNSIVAVSSPYTLTQSAAIGASVQVIQDASKVLGPCNNSNFEVPRSRINGFDIEQNTVILFGGCRPNADGQALIVNYYYWVVTQCGDGILQSDGVNGEQCDPGPNVAGDCCDANCRFETSPGYQCTVAGGGCGAGNNTCQLGLCVTSTCPDYCVACGETAPNYCTVALGCVGPTCGYQNRTCLPINCNKRTCIRTMPNSLIPGLMGDCVLVMAEQGYICDTDYCVVDVCGWCNGDNTTCSDCSGVPNGNKVLDVCGLCGGNTDTCCSCADPTFCAPFAPKFDSCGVCGGNGLSCVPCTLGTSGLLGLDSCGVCGGEGTTCLPTYQIQVNFDSPPGPTPSCDACCQILNSVNGTLLAMGLSPNVQTLTCDLKESCDPSADPTCLPGKTSYIVNIQTVVFEGATLTATDVSNNLQVDGLIFSPTFGLNLVGPNPTIVVAPEIVVTTGNAGSTNPTAATSSPNPSNGGTSTGQSSGGGAAPVVVAVTFPSYANGQQLYNDPTQLQTLISQTIAELVAAGQLPGTAADYTGTASFDPVSGTISISVTPTSGSYPGGSQSCTTCTTGTSITPAICQGLCSASVSEVQTPTSSVSSGNSDEVNAGAASLLWLSAFL